MLVDFIHQMGEVRISESDRVFADPQIASQE